MDLSSMLNDSVPKGSSVNNTGNSYHHNSNRNHVNRNYSMPNQTAGASTIVTTPLPTNNHTYPTNGITSSNPHAKERTVAYQLSASLQYIVAKDSILNPHPTPTPPSSLHASHQNHATSLLSSPFRPRTENTNSPRLNVPQPSNVSSSPNASCLYLGHMVSKDPTVWKPKLSLKMMMKEQPMNVRPAKRARMEENAQDGPAEQWTMEVPLKTTEISIRGDEPPVLLEEVYEIQGAYPRGFFVMMAKRNVQHNFVFEYPLHPWFEDLYGLRKSAYVSMRTNDGELYELHLKPSRDKQYLFGYLIKHVDMLRIVKESLNELLFQRKLPLVLDLDDTLVRLVGEGNERYVPEADIPKCRDRVATLKDGRRVVLTERVHEFLEWAQNLYDISVCSLGDQNYVDNVVSVLDPQRTRIRGILYSARTEFEHIKKSPDPGRPPKDLLALYSFCALKDGSIGSSFTLPLILDDETRMWPLEQHDNIIEVLGQVNAPVWSVSLFPHVRDTLLHVHKEFFRQFDIWYGRMQEAEQNGMVYNRLPPSATGIYKIYLRHILRDMIARGPPPPPTLTNNNHH